ncbi:MAG: leucyl aminopeptidase family protein [Candidatus Pacebacteria bacterium]|nr:leucyl aminopeptidase family protein [Candidatus Paceibacterota bacterium]
MKITTHVSPHTLTPTVYTLVTLNAERDHTVTLEKEDGATTLSIGIEGKTPMNRRRFITLIRRVVQEAKARKLKKITLMIDELMTLEGLGLERAELVRLIAENMHMANYEYTVYKAKPKKGWNMLEEVALVGVCTSVEKASLKIGEIVAEEVNACRELANTPGGDMTPDLLAKRIKKSAVDTGAKVTVFGKKEMEKLKMGAILGVGRGAKEEPKFIIVEYWGGKKNVTPIVLVGKGITFDTGGLSLKPTDYMLDMHLDMSGGAAVAHAVIAVARFKLPVNVVALIPAAENAVSGESYRPGDVLRSMSGKTIDVLNTDAEGRLVLADALTYAKKYTPALVVDVATLTGASLVALGTKASAVLTKDTILAQRLMALGEESGDYLWPLPMWEEYAEMVKGKHGDVANIPVKNDRYAGTIGGGMFLAEFAEGYPWAHIDMAPRMINDKGDHLSDGATGTPVRLLVRLLEQDTNDTSSLLSNRHV